MIWKIITTHVLIKITSGWLSSGAASWTAVLLIKFGDDGVANFLNLLEFFLVVLLLCLRVLL